MIGIINQDTQAGWLPTIGNQKYLLAILVVAILTGLMYIYLNYSKHGYEIAVVGDSPNTARLVADEGQFLYHSDYYGDDLPFWQLIEKSDGSKRCCRLRKSVEIWRHRMAAEFGVERCTKLGPIGPRVLMSRLFASERRISHRRVALRDAVVAIVGMQRNFIVRPDPVAQIIKHFDHGPGLCR